MDGEAWWAAVHEVTKSWTRLSDFTVTFHFHALEKEMATHSSVLAWRIPGTGEPGGLPSLDPHRVGHDWSDLTATATATENGNQVQYCCLENSIDSWAWWVTVHVLAKVGHNWAQHSYSYNYINQPSKVNTWSTRTKLRGPRIRITCGGRSRY